MLEIIESKILGPRTFIREKMTISGKQTSRNELSLTTTQK